MRTEWQWGRSGALAGEWCNLSGELSYEFLAPVLKAARMIDFS